MRDLRRQGQGEHQPLPRPQQALVREVPLRRLVGYCRVHFHLRRFLLHLLRFLFHLLRPILHNLQHLPSYFDTGVYLKLYPPGEQNMEEGRVKDSLGKEVAGRAARALQDSLGQCRAV